MLHKVSICLLALLWALPLLNAEPDDDAARVHINLYKKTRPAVVGIQAGSNIGTGTIISADGLILTSSVIVGKRSSVYVWLEGNRRISGKVIDVNRTLEIAFVKIEMDDDLPWIEIGDSGSLRIGQRVYTIGDTYNSILNDDMPALSVGVLSGRFELKEQRRKQKYTGPVLEITSAVNPGQDGAPLLNSDGRLVGVVTLTYSRQNWSGLAIPINLALTDLRKHKILEQKPAETGPGYLGVVVGKTSVFTDGVIVEVVRKDSPAKRDGLDAGDFILLVNGQTIDNPKALYTLIQTYHADDDVKLTIKRSGKKTELTVKLGKLPY